MATYQPKKSYKVDAVQWFPGVSVAGVEEIDPCSPDDLAYGSYVENAEVETLNGTVTISEGDWVVTDFDGKISVCKPKAFEAIYELVLWDDA